MLEQIKKFTDTAKGIIMWIITPIALVAMSVAYVLYKNSNLKHRVAELEIGDKVQKEKGISDEADKKAATSLDEYRELKKQYDDGGKPDGAA